MRNGQVDDKPDSERPEARRGGEATTAGRRQARIEPGGDRYGGHRVIVPKGALPQPAWRLDNDFSRLFEGEALLAVETLNIDAASFAQMEQGAAGAGGVGAAPQAHGTDDLAHIVVRTVAERGKQHNPVTGSGGMLLGRVLQIAPGRADDLRVGDRVASLVSLSLTPLRIDRVVAVRRESAQLDVQGEAVLFATGACAKLPTDIPERLALAALDVAGAAPQVARRVQPGAMVVVLGGGGKSGVLCVAEARRRGGAGATIIAVEANHVAAEELGALGLCDAVIVADARDARAVASAVHAAARGREADVTFSCVNVADAESAAVLVTRERGAVYFFAMSTSFTQAALGAEGLGRDVDLFIGNGYAAGHAEHTLAMLRQMPDVRALFERRYG
ncbi:MAG: L-erythro-3,5-diaminohexanoate dehydrogenase [Myxococcota bacterium]|nr:L-erythro-3,5-diaminohexanoate dehydrogenase [Myxococcota bacterium]